MKKNKEKGFSLLEIIIAVTILAIVSAITVPYVLSAKRDTEIAAENATAKTLNEALVRAFTKEDAKAQELVNAGNQIELIQYLYKAGYINPASIEG